MVFAEKMRKLREVQRFKTIFHTPMWAAVRGDPEAIRFDGRG